MRYQVVTKHSTQASLNGVHPFRVGMTDYGNGAVYFADSPQFGCSKNYASPEAAIRAMCADHGCHVVSITLALVSALG